MNACEGVTDLSHLLQLFFCQRLIQQRRVSHRTVTSYRDTFRLLLRFAEQQFGKPASKLCLADVDVNLVLGFLDHLEVHRHNGIRSRNVRLAAIRAFLQYAALHEPTALAQIQRVLAIPMKPFDHPLVSFLTRKEMEAIINASDTATWNGQRDYALLTTLYNTGARVSEIIAVKRRDVECEHCTAVHLHGKGRKERVVPLWKRTSALLRKWMEQMAPNDQQSLFPQSLRSAHESFRCRKAITDYGAVGLSPVPISSRQDDIAPCGSTHRRHGITRGWCRHRCHCYLAWS